MRETLKHVDPVLRITIELFTNGEDRELLALVLMATRYADDYVYLVSVDRQLFQAVEVLLQSARGLGVKAPLNVKALTPRQLLEAMT